MNMCLLVRNSTEHFFQRLLQRLLYETDSKLDVLRSQISMKNLTLT